MFPLEQQLAHLGRPAGDAGYNKLVIELDRETPNTLELLKVRVAASFRALPPWRVRRLRSLRVAWAT